MTGWGMAKIELRYVQSFADRHGRMRFYFRRKGSPRATLPGIPGSPEFMEAYRAALSGTLEPPMERLGERSFARLVGEYYRTVAFTRMAASSQKAYRIALKVMVDKYGQLRVDTMRRRNAEKIISDIGSTRPGMANLTKAVMRKVFKYAIKLEWREDNPFAGIENFRTGSHHTWTDGELAKFEKRWKPGTRERLAYELLLCTDQRGGDVVRMRRSDIVKGLLQVVQGKTRKPLKIAIQPRLRQALDAYPVKGIYLIGDVAGRPIARGGLTKFMMAAAAKAGLPKRCKPHGLRKALLRQMAENDATAHEMQAVSGHASLEQLQVYTKDAEQERLMRSAFAKLTKGRTVGVKLKR